MVRAKIITYQANGVSGDYYISSINLKLNNSLLLRDEYQNIIRNIYTGETK